jgi:hypothetical protein
MEITNIIAVLLSPLIAVLVSVYIQDRAERRRTKTYIFNTLIMYRNRAPNEELVRALNMIDVVFRKNMNIRNLWKEYFSMLSNDGLSNPVSWAQREHKNLEMLTEMAKVLGYSSKLTSLDIERVYFPIGLKDQIETNAEISNELKRLLKESKAISLIAKEET